MIYIKFSLVSFLFFILMGCSTIKKMSPVDEFRQSDDYNQVLSIPKEMQAFKISDNYPVPEITQTNSAVKSANVLILPPESSLVK